MRILGINALFHDPALASHRTPRFLDRLREHVHATGRGGFRAHGVDWAGLAPPRAPGEPWTRDHADLAASVQAVRRGRACA